MNRLLHILFGIIPLVTTAQPYDTIYLSYRTSVNIIFTSPVEKWDMGLGVRMENGRIVSDVLVENPETSPERIKLTAGIENFPATNLFVETTDAYYNFILLYKEWPENLLLKIDPQKASIIKEVPTFEEKHDSEDTVDSLEYYCKKVQDLDGEITSIGTSSQKMLYYLGGIYVKGDYLFFQVYIKNEGNVKYDVGYIGFSRKDKRRKINKIHPTQEEQLNPVLVTGEEKRVIESGRLFTRVYAFKKFTLSKSQSLSIEFWEGSQGMRKKELIVKSKDILKAKILPVP
jgi:hypothetical protein